LKYVPVISAATWFALIMGMSGFTIAWSRAAQIAHRQNFIHRPTPRQSAPGPLQDARQPVRLLRAHQGAVLARLAGLNDTLYH
jgi:hypothetical protein